MIRKFLSIHWFTVCCFLQNRHDKGVIAKFFLSNELAPESLPGLACSDLYIHYSGLKERTRQAHVVVDAWVRWLWGLTCDFWAENSKTKLIQSRLALATPNVYAGIAKTHSSTQPSPGGIHTTTAVKDFHDKKDSDAVWRSVPH
jgi:hypothetical protein